MSIYDAVNRRNKGGTGTASGSSSLGKKISEANKQKKERERVSDASSFGLGSFGSDLASTSKSLYDYSSTWHSPEDMANAKQGFENMYNRIGSYIDYTKKYGITMPQEFDIEGLRDAYGSVLAGWDDLAFDYGNFKNADEYNKVMTEAIERDKYLSTVNVPELEAELASRNENLAVLEKKAVEENGRRNRIKTKNYRSRGLIGPDAKIEEQEAEAAYKAAVRSLDIAKNEIGTLERDITLAKREQAKNKLTADVKRMIGNDTEAGTAIAQGKMLAESGHKKELNRSIGVPGASGSKISSSAEDANQIISFGSEEEQNAYYYLLGSGQTDKANAYAGYLKDSLNAREGRQKRKDADTYLEKLLVGVGAGFEQFGSGIEGLFNFSGEYKPTSALQYASHEIRQELTQQGRPIARLGFDVAQTGANMLPSIAASAITGNPTIGAVTMGASAGGNSYQEMINQGYSQGQAYTYGILTGVSEAALQKVMGGIGALGGTSSKIATAVGSLKNGIAKFALRWGGSMASEGLEEAAQEILTPIFKSIATGEAPESVDWGEVAYSALLGGLLGAGEGVSIGANVIGENRVGKAIKGNERINDVFDMASLSPEESQAYELYTRLADSGVTADNVSNAQLGSLASQIATDAQQTIKSKTATAEQKTSASKALSDIKVYAQKSAGAKLSKKEVKDFSAGDVTRLIGSGLESGKDTEAYKLATEYKKKLVGDGKLETKTVEASKVKLSEKEIRKLMDANASALKAETLASNPETESEQKTKALARYNAGEVLTEAEYKLLNGTETLEAAQKEVDSLSKVMDDVSAKLFTELYDGKVNQERYAEDFTRVMFYAARNYSDDYILKNSGVITPAQVSKIVSETITNNARQREASQKKAFEEMGGVFAHQADIDDSAVNYGDTPVKGKVNFNSLNMRQRNSIAFAMGLSRALGTDLVIEPDNPKYNGKFSKSTRKIYINAYAGKIDGQPFKNALIPALSHETTHRMELESPALFRELSNIVFSTLEKADGVSEADRIAQEQIRLDIESPKKSGKKHTEEEARSEIVARACEDMLSRSEKAVEMFSALTEEQQKGFVGTIRQIIAELKKAIRKLLATFKTDSYEASVLRNFEEELNEMQKLWDKMLENSVAANQVFKEQMLKGIDGKPIDPERITSNELDVEYSLKYNGDIAKGQLEYLEKNKAYISEEELKEAQKVTAAMVDVMIKHSSILPEDKIGKVLTKNGSYDRSVENTTICVRTLAYNEFIDKVQEEIGRPLTQMESFLVSQKLYDIATEPQCLYCYVSLDRKAFNEMLLRYMHDRDTVIAKYNESDKSDEAVSKLYEEFLNGRKDTKEMKSRFDKWIGYVDNGTQLLSLADIATEDRQSVIKAEGGILAEQLADARKYAQNASWSKIQKNYVAYRDEILKLGGQVVKNLNEHYGLRWYSFSDYSAAFIVENMQQITDASIRGLKGLAYTKDTDFVEIFAPSGMNINVSVFVNQDANGNFYIDEKQSADFEKAQELRAKYPNVGIVATVTNDEALKWAGEQEWSDVIIPFHIVRTGTDVAEYYKWLNYTSESGDTIKDNDLWNAYVDSLNPKSENARKKVSKNIYPSEHKNNKETYLSLCESRGLNPRFVRFAGESWYMKLVNETRLSADNSSVLKPNYNLEAAQSSFQKFVDKGGYEGGWYKEGVKVDEEAKAVASDVLAGKKANEVDYGRQDNFNPEELVASRKKQRTHSNELSVDDDVQFSDKNTESVYDLMGESERLAEENKKLAADVELLKERLKLEKTVTHGKYAKSSTLLNAASVILGKAQSKYSKVDLAKRIGDVYTYIASDPDVSAQGIFDRLYPIAEDVLAEAKVEVEVDYAIKDLLKDLKKTRISLDNTQIAEMEYRFGKDWHKRFFNKIIIAEDGIPLDSKWQEWAENIPAYFDADINSADQIGALYDLIDTLKEASERVIEYDHAEQARWLAEEIYNQFWNITPYESTADKYEKKISELKSKHKQMMTELRTKRDAREKQRLEEQKTLEAMYYGRRLREKDIEKEKAVADQRLADDIHYGKIIRKIDIKNTQERDKQKLADHMYYGRLIHNLRTRKENEVAHAKELGRQKLAEHKESIEKKTRIQRITANVLALNEMLINNSKDKHINEDLKGPVIQLLTAIDFSSKRMLEGGEPTKQDERLSKALSKVKEMFADASNGKEGLNDLYGHGLDEDIKKMIESVERIVDSLGGKDLTLNMMTLEDLQTLDKVMRTVKAAVNNVNKFHVAKHAEGIANLSRATMGYLNELGQTILHKGLRGKLDKLLTWNNALPYYVFKRYGVGGRVIFRALMDGQDKLAFNVKQIIDYAESTYTKDEIKEWDEEVKTFNIPVPKKKADSETEGQKTDDSAIEYQTIKMTVPQIMSLYCLTKREQARKHLFAGGIRVADFETKKGGIVSQTGNVIFTEEGVAQILDSLTERQKEVADKLQEFLNTVCPEWGNEVSMARFGYKAFGEKNYFPIYSDKNNLAVDDESDKINSLFRLLNMSFTKPTDDNANNTIIVSNIFDVFAQHTSDMAKYNALALPVLDTFKWYNYNEKEEIVDGKHKTHSVKQSIETAFGKDGQSYLMTFLRDINGQQESDRDSISKEFMRNFKIASVGMNLRVAALQPTSYLRAGAVIDNKYLVKAFAFKDKARGRAIDMAKKYCGIALWKSMGYYDTNIQRGVESQIKHDETWKDKAVEKSMYLAQKADEMTWGVLWNACELEIRDKRKDLEVGSEEFYETIGKRLREVIYATQVVDSVMTRSQMMRSTKLHDQIMTNFASEPTLGYNMLYDAYMSMALETRRTGSKKKAWEKHGKKIQRLAVSYTLTCTVTAAIEVAFDAFRNDDDEEKNLLLAWLTNFLSNMSITSKIPYIKELHSVIKGYRTSRSELAWVEDAWNAGNRISKLVQGKGDFEKTLRACLKALSELTGLPGFSAYRDGYALIETIGDFIE